MLEAGGGVNPYPGLEIPKQIDLTTEYTNVSITNPEQTPNPVYPQDYTFNTTFNIKDQSNQYNIVNVNNDLNTIEQWDDKNDQSNYEFLNNTNNLIKTYTTNPTNPKLFSNKSTKLININNWIGTLTLDDNISNGQYNINQLLQNKRFADKINLQITRQGEQPVTGGANITKNGQYTPNEFNHSTGDLLPEGTYSNNQYIDQINVNVPTYPFDLKYIAYNVNSVWNFAEIENINWVTGPVQLQPNNIFIGYNKTYSNTRVFFWFCQNTSNETITIGTNNDWCATFIDYNQYPDMIGFSINNNSDGSGVIVTTTDYLSDDNYLTNIILYKNYFNYDRFRWTN